jgi:uncharacterized protein YegJ (DUF2314 family)
VIDNAPVDVPSLREGQRVTLSRGEVVDWMYFDGAEGRGGYTIAALVHGTPEQKGYEAKMGIRDWSRYKFLKLPRGAGR